MVTNNIKINIRALLMGRFFFIRQDNTLLDRGKWKTMDNMNNKELGPHSSREAEKRKEAIA